MKVRFLAPFHYSPPHFKGRVMLAYRPGFVGTVKRECGEQAVAEGKAVRLGPPPPAPDGGDGAA